LVTHKENIKEVQLKDEIKSSYIDYAMSVVIGRAIPDVRDGLKPVHRRIIYAMTDNNWFYNRAHVKCAKIVGECFVKGTLINTQKGLEKIEDLSIGDLVYTHNGLKEITKLFELPEQQLYQIELENGLKNVCTKGQKFKVLTQNLEFKWKTPVEMKIGDYIVCRSIYNNTDNYINIRENLIFDEEISYLFGLILATKLGEEDNKKKNQELICVSKSLKSIEKIQYLLLNKLNQRENISKDNSGRYLIKIKRFNLNQEINNTFYSNNIADNHSSINDILKILFCSPKDVIFAFFNGYLEGNGFIDENRSLLKIYSISECFLRSLQVLLFSLGLNSIIYSRNTNNNKNYDGNKIKEQYDKFSLVICENDFFKIYSFLNGLNQKKTNNLNNKKCCYPSKFEKIPFLGPQIFNKLFNRKVYLRKNRQKIRIGHNPKEPFKNKYFRNYLNKIKIYKSTVLRFNILNNLKQSDPKLSLFIKNVLNNNLSFIKIKNIKKTSVEKTYDIQVKDDHQFIANGMISHNCLGNFHPHGDSAVYNALVRMGQDFSLRYPLIDPQGNFGSIDGDPPAAYRYTEARLSQIANEMIEDLYKGTVVFQPNFDDSREEPRYFPSKLPNILINGTKGIAVGMATSMAPHNLIEVCQGIISTIDNPDISIEELMEIIKGPDFPTGGIITDTSGIYNAYATGQGSIPLRGKIDKETKGKKLNLVITEIPYLINKSSLIESIAKLIRDGVLKDIRDLRDESDRTGMRIVLELKKDAQIPIIKNILFKHTKLLTNFNVINLVLINDGKQPKILNLKELIQEYINYRLEVIYKRTDFDLKKTEKRLHKVEGLLIALKDIDNIITIIKKSKDSNAAKINLKKAYELSDIQITSILKMPLSRLTGLEQQKLLDEQKNLTENIKKFKEILENKQIRLKIIKNELTELSKKYGDKRKTKIIEQETIKNIEKKDLVKREPTIVMLTKNHYIKRLSLEEYRTQRRGGRGKRGATIGEQDFVTDLFVCSTHDTILFFTSKGRVYSIKCFEIPFQTRVAKGKPIVNLINLRQGEKISEMIPINNFNTTDKLIMVTKNGIVKKTPLKIFSKIKRTGIRAQIIKDDDELVSVKKLTNELQDIFIGTKLGYAIRFDESELRELGRNTMGVKGVDLRKDDEVIGCLLVTDETKVLTLTRNGYGQRTQIKEYRKTGRAAKGVINITLKEEENDKVIAIRIAEDKDLLIGTEQGQVIRVPVDSIRITHRKAKGVRVINLYENDLVSSIGKCAKDIDE